MQTREKLRYMFLCELFAQLTPDQQKKIISEIEAILSGKGSDPVPFPTDK